MAELAVWLYGQKVAVITRERDRLTTEYTEEAHSTYPGGTPLLSLSMPLSYSRYGNGISQPFWDGLLPEGDARDLLAADYDLVSRDTYGLIRELGRDCAGALVIQPNDLPCVKPSHFAAIQPLTGAEIGALVDRLRTAPLGVGGDFRGSLAGVQEKLLLTRLPSGKWGQPKDGTPSTHILKPQIPRVNFPNSVENEVFCMKVAQQLNLPVARVGLARLGDRKIAVIERYDRFVDETGELQRVHQEDFCQATSTSNKYQDEGGPSLLKMSRLLRRAPAGTLDELLRMVTLNTLVGNADAHGKNFSILHNANGAIALAPLYDVLCLTGYRRHNPAMTIDGAKTFKQITASRIVNEGVSWGMERVHAADVVDDILSRAREAIASAAVLVPGLPTDIQNVVGIQLATVKGERQAVTIELPPEPSEVPEFGEEFNVP